MFPVLPCSNAVSESIHLGQRKTLWSLYITLQETFMNLTFVRFILIGLYCASMESFNKVIAKINWCNFLAQRAWFWFNTNSNAYRSSRTLLLLRRRDATDVGLCIVLVRIASQKRDDYWPIFYLEASTVPRSELIRQPIWWFDGKRVML